MARMFQMIEGYVHEVSEQRKDWVCNQTAYMNTLRQDIRPELQVTVIGIYYLISMVHKPEANFIEPSEKQMEDIKKIFQFIKK